MKKRVSGVVLSAAMLASAVLPTAGAGMVSAESTAPADLSTTLPLQAWYDKPAEMTSEGWEQQATQLGNGFLGAMVFGGVSRDKIQVNEHTLWSGGPGANASYNGGVKGTAEEHKETLQEVRQKLQEYATDFSENKAAYIDPGTGKLVTNNYSYGAYQSELDAAMNSLFGEKSNFGSYQTLGDILISDLKENDSYTDYKRVLDLNNGMVSVSYKQDGVTYTREYFISNPGNVMVMRLTASEKGKLSRKISIDSVQASKSIYGDIHNNTITMTGRPSDHTEDGLKFAQQLKVIPEGGSILTLGDTAYVDNADSITLVMTAGTNYQQCMDDTYDYFTDENPLDAVEERIAAAVQKGYDNLLAAHKADYQKLFNAMQLNIGGLTTVPNKPTDQLLAAYGGRTDNPNTTEEDLYLENLYFQFGRYLLISSSREGSLPANLQGIWADGTNPPWNADYHTNINLQMNYWLAQQTNLAECHTPVIEYVKAQVPRGTEMANTYYCKQDGSPVRGFVFHHENNIWGNAAPGESGASYAPESAAWSCQDIWEYYQFTQDKAFLAENYDVLLQAALFWVDNLWTDSRDGTLVANPSYSPEHGPYTLGATFVQSVVWEIFNEVIEASEVLGKNTSEVNEIKAAQSKLSPPSIGLGGQFQEWKDETTQDVQGDNGHRHVNHLFALHPGNQIVAGRSEEDDAYVDAMRQTLETRGDGGTGWSKAWKINFWARLRDGDHAHTMVSELLKESTAKNLFDLHPPFQIDGNFGGTAGMAEMLLQSQGDAVELLAATPDAWDNGTVTGMKARGNVEVDMSWHHNTLATAVLRPGTDNSELKVKGTNIANGTLTDSKGNKVVVKAEGTDTIIFNAKAGETYTLANIVDTEGLAQAKTQLTELITEAQAAYDSKKPTDELYDAAANKVLKDAIDEAKAVLSSNTTDKYVLIDAVSALRKALDAFEAAYNMNLDVSLNDGIYSGLKQVTVKNASNIIKVRYTLDGSTPTKDSPLYSGPIVLPYGRTQLHVAAFHNDKLVGKVVAREYLVNVDENLAKGAAATDDSNRTISGYPISRILDGDLSSRWATNSTATADLVATIDLKKNVTFDSYLLSEFCEIKETTRVNSLKVEYWTGSKWAEIPVAAEDRFIADNDPDHNPTQYAYKAATFEPITTQKVRLTMKGANISIYEFSLFYNNQSGDKTELNALVTACGKLNLNQYQDTAAFEAALAAAKTVQSNAKATISDVNIAYQNLLNAKAALVEKPAAGRGDVNGDGEVTAEDALLALQAATKKITLDSKAQQAADVNGKDGVTAEDALMILQAATKKIVLGDGQSTTSSTSSSSQTKPTAPLPTATKSELKAEMDKEVDTGRYTDETVRAYEQTLEACNVVYNDPSMSGENIYRALVALQNAKAGLTEKTQSNWLGTFSKMSGDFTVLNAGGTILYADWKQIDQSSIDLSGDRSNLRLQMTIRLKSTNSSVDPATIWNTLTIKLRSADKENVAGDPDSGNSEHNYGWDFQPSAFDGTSTLKISIPLDKAYTNHKGVMDWGDVQKLIIQCFLNDKATGDKYQYSMNVSGVRIVDLAPINETKAKLSQEASRDVNTDGYDADKVAAYNKALAKAKELLQSKDEMISLYDVNKAYSDLTNAYNAMVGK